ARAEGMPEDWIEAAQNSPIWKLITDYEVALPLHPEYRTLPMVWYIPPLSPVVDVVTASGNDGEDAKTLLTALSTMRIPLEYLAELFTAGDTAPVERVLRRLAAMRSYMRDINLGEEPREETAAAVGMTGAEIQEMYRLLAIAKYEDRYVIPSTHAEIAQDLEEMACSLDVHGGPGMGGMGPFGTGSGADVPASVENFHALKDRQTSPYTPSTPGRTNLLNWDGRGSSGLFPPAADERDDERSGGVTTAVAVDDAPAEGGEEYHSGDIDSGPGVYDRDPYPAGDPGPEAGGTDRTGEHSPGDEPPIPGSSR
ncbi:MAG TPA: hypothetical protein VK046_00425, partial [Actinomycetaceae bacterium]|nr:hypothetical protein [Actinomycetaceae bacterium]